MPTIVNTFETGLSSGTTLSAANSGDGSAGTPLDAVTTAGGNTIVFSNAHPAHGALGALITIAASAGQAAYAEWSTALLASSTSALTYARIGVYLTSLPVTELGILRGMFGANQRWRVALSTTGAIVVRNAANTTVGTSTATVPTGGHRRIEVAAAAHASAGSIEVRIYVGDATTPTETMGPYTSQALGGPIDRIRYGVGAAAAPASTTTIYVDDLGGSTTGWLGPAVALPTVGHVWVGAVTDDAATVSYELGNVTSARLVVSESDDLSSPVYSSSGAPDADGVIKLVKTSLTANTQYYFGVEADGVVLTDGRGEFVTDPTAGSQASFSVAFGSCQQTNSNSETFEAIADREGPYGRARRFVHLGDMHYRDFGAGATAADVVEQYRTSLAPTRFRALLSTIPTAHGWDNHDWGGTDSNAAAPAGAALAAGYRQVVPHYTLATPGSTAIYQSWVVGRVRFILLDTRSERSDRTLTESSSKRMLSADQVDWFKDELLQPEPVKIVCSGIYWRRDSSTGDRWGSYSTQWAEIRDWVATQPTIQALVISGDRHALYADDGTGGGSGGSYWPNAGGAPFDQGSTGSFEAWTHGYYAGTVGTNLKAFGWLDITDGGAEITVDYSGISTLDGLTRVSMSTTFSASTTVLPGRWGIHL